MNIFNACVHYQPKCSGENVQNLFLKTFLVVGYPLLQPPFGFLINNTSLFSDEIRVKVLSHRMFLLYGSKCATPTVTQKENN